MFFDSSLHSSLIVTPFLLTSVQIVGQRTYTWVYIHPSIEYHPLNHIQKKTSEDYQLLTNTRKYQRISTTVQPLSTQYQTLSTIIDQRISTTIVTFKTTVANPQFRRHVWERRATPPSRKHLRFSGMLLNASKPRPSGV